MLKEWENMYVKGLVSPLPGCSGEMMTLDQRTGSQTSSSCFKWSWTNFRLTLMCGSNWIFLGRWPHSPPWVQKRQINHNHPGGDFWADLFQKEYGCPFICQNCLCLAMMHLTVILEIEVVVNGSMDLHLMMSTHYFLPGIQIDLFSFWHDDINSYLEFECIVPVLSPQFI